MSWFSGRSMVIDAAGRIVAEAAAFEEDLLIDVRKPATGLQLSPLSRPAKDWTRSTSIGLSGDVIMSAKTALQGRDGA